MTPSPIDERPARGTWRLQNGHSINEPFRYPNPACSCGCMEHAQVESVRRVMSVCLTCGKVLSDIVRGE